MLWWKKSLLENIFHSKKNFSPKNFLIEKMFWLKKVLFEIIFLLKNFLVEKIFWLKKYFGRKKISQRKIDYKYFGQKSLSQNFFLSKNCLVKKIWVIKIFAQKNFIKKISVIKILDSKIFGSKKDFGVKEIFFKENLALTSFLLISLVGIRFRTVTHDNP